MAAADSNAHVENLPVRAKALPDLVATDLVRASCSVNVALPSAVVVMDPRRSTRKGDPLRASGPATLFCLDGVHPIDVATSLLEESAGLLPTNANAGRETSSSNMVKNHLPNRRCRTAAEHTS